jgi:signal transduction histidine kinase
MRVLIAEDHAVSRWRLQHFLKQWGHVVTAAQDGAEAWHLFLEGDFPIVITDWLMPEMDGVELIRRIRTNHPGSGHQGYVYIILLTACTEKGAVVEGMEAGADDFVTKPFDLEELRVRLRAGERIIRLEQSLAVQNRTLQETQTALYQSEKLAGLGRLAAGLAHEINNPIGYVTNNVAVLRRDILAALELLNKYREGLPALHSVAPDLAALVSQMEDEIDLAFTLESFPRLFDKSLEGLQRIRDIVRNLRDFARLDEADFKDADLNTGLLATVEILRHEMKQKALRVETRLQDLPPLRCHPGKINQVFLNLLTNAIQACAPCGTIEVRSRYEKPAESRSETSDRGGDIVFEVEDNGCGICEDHLPHIFEPFFTTRPVGQGMGMGLAVSYGIVRDHGGAITVESAVVRGSTFQVRLPLKPAPAEQHSEETRSPGNEAATVAGPGSGIRGAVNQQRR